MIDFIFSYWWFVLILLGLFLLNSIFCYKVVNGIEKEKLERERKQAPTYIMIMMLSVNGLLIAILIALLMIHSKL
tara:strand:+ start:457 stop:681 length:225 start_codon:yes stop_codon:yes gene_type:complete